MPDHIPILRLNGHLLVTIQVDLHDELALQLQDDLTNMLSRAKAKGVLIDISSVEIVDSFIGKTLSHIAGISRIMDAVTVLVGMKPAVAITLVELGISLKGIRTALNVDRGMQLLGEATAEATAEPR
jgi:rsbT antagonist protein RsbS